MTRKHTHAHTKWTWWYTKGLSSCTYYDEWLPPWGLGWISGNCFSPFSPHNIMPLVKVSVWSDSQTSQNGLGTRLLVFTCVFLTLFRASCFGEPTRVHVSNAMFQPDWLFHWPRCIGLSLFHPVARSRHSLVAYRNVTASLVPSSFQTCDISWGGTWERGYLQLGTKDLISENHSCCLIFPAWIHADLNYIIWQKHMMKSFLLQKPHVIVCSCFK